MAGSEGTVRGDHALDPLARLEEGWLTLSGSGCLQGRYEYVENGSASRGISAWPQAQVVVLSECGTHALCDAGDWPHDGRRWPRACACGYSFGPEDEWRLAITRLWRRPATGEQFPLIDGRAELDHGQAEPA